MNDRTDQSGRTVILPPDDDDALVPLRYRFDGWSAPKQRRFLAALGETGCVRDACRGVGMSSTSAYRLRARSAEFAAAWDRALAMAATVLDHAAFERAVIGVEEPVWHHGKVVGTRRRYSDGLLRLLVLRGDTRAGLTLTQEEKVAAAKAAAYVAGGYFSTAASREETNAAIIKQLGVRRRGLRREEAERAMELLAAGLVP